jgi:hypothetical protein
VLEEKKANEGARRAKKRLKLQEQLQKKGMLKEVVNLWKCVVVPTLQLHGTQPHRVARLCVCVSCRCFPGLYPIRVSPLQARLHRGGGWHAKQGVDEAVVGVLCGARLHLVRAKVPASVADILVFIRRLCLHHDGHGDGNRRNRGVHCRLQARSIHVERIAASNCCVASPIVSFAVNCALVVLTAVSGEHKRGGGVQRLFQARPGNTHQLRFRRGTHR